MTYVVIGMAGIIGAWLRYGLGLWAHGWDASPIWLGTLIANYSGSFALGWFTTRAARTTLLQHPLLRLGIGTGLIGSYTTFSTFSVETVEMMRAGAWGEAAAYVLVSLWGGLLFSWLGHRLADGKTEHGGGGKRR